MALGTQPPSLLLPSFIIRGLSRDRPDGPVQQARVWERVTRGQRDRQGQDHRCLHLLSAVWATQASSGPGTP